jgi:hypothetical protein
MDDRLMEALSIWEGLTTEQQDEILAAIKVSKSLCPTAKEAHPFQPRSSIPNGSKKQPCGDHSS